MLARERTRLGHVLQKEGNSADGGGREPRIATIRPSIRGFDLYASGLSTNSVRGSRHVV